MQQLKLTAAFCGPSLFSAISVCISSVIILLSANFSSLLGSGALYDVIFGHGTPYDLIQNSHDSVAAVNKTVLGNSVLNNILFFAFWMMIGLFVYVTIATLSHSVAETEESLESMHYVHARKKIIQQNILLRWSVRIGGVLAGLIYSWVFFSFLLPFSILASRVALGSLSTIIGWLYLILASIVLVMGLHIFVILIRIISLRPRVFGNSDIPA